MKPPRTLRPLDSSPQGEAVAVWLLWVVVLAVIAVTYTRLDPAQLYHVSRDGLDGGFSRVLVAMNFPIALVAIALVLVALGALPRRAWWVGGTAIAMCAVTAWPGVVDEADLDARAVNIVPAIGVCLAVALTVAASSRAGTCFAPGRTFDRARVAVTIAVLVLSLPWLAAELGVYLPDVVFLTGRDVAQVDGSTQVAVHHGHHHGLDGALLIITAVFLSRPMLRPGPLATATTLYVSLAFGYGAVNFAQDFWQEQFVKRDWSRWQFPSALEPTVEPIWLITLAITGATAVAFRQEARLDGHRRAA